ncbi:MAG: methyltransferase [Spirochaetia bacterium]|nr:methyltransferase [Spirochaetia bacterium]
MAEFISSFITGFQHVVEKNLPQILAGVKILHVYDGLIHYQYAGDSHNLDKIIYFNNTFFVLKTMKGKGLNFPSLVGAVSSEKKYYLINKGTFRVRFQNENQFVKVDKNISKKAEETVLHNSKLHLDRLSPTTEIWYSIRREGFAFCGQLISKREFTEKNLNKGELRPEIAYLICCYADLNQDDVVAEPFCGYGSIPVQLIKKFRFQKLFASDIDKEKISINMQKKQLKDNPQIELSVNDAFVLPQIIDRSVDVVITDPPWGYFEQIDDIGEFYKKMFTSFKRILKENGRMIILSARKDEIEKAALEMNVQILSSLHTLVNGKKASLYKMTF